MDNLSSILREMGRESKWQIIYSQSKEIYLPIFTNIGNYSELQILFLYYLSFYNSLSECIALGETNDLVYENTIYEDSFMYYRSIKHKIEKEKNKKEVKSSSNNPTSQWIFKGKK